MARRVSSQSLYHLFTRGFFASPSPVYRCIFTFQIWFTIVNLDGNSFFLSISFRFVFPCSPQRRRKMCPRFGSRLKLTSSPPTRPAGRSSAPFFVPLPLHSSCPTVGNLLFCFCCISFLSHFDIGWRSTATSVSRCCHKFWTRQCVDCRISVFFCRRRAAEQP